MKKIKFNLNLLIFSILFLTIFLTSIPFVNAAKPKIIIPEPQVNLGFNYSPPDCTTNVKGETVCKVNWLGEYVSGVYNLAIKMGGLIAAIMLMVGGILWLVSGGDVSKVSQAKDILADSIIDINILLSSYLLLALVNPNLVNFNELDLNVAQDKNFPDTEATEGGTALPEEFRDACAAAKAGDLGPCQALGKSAPSNLAKAPGGILVNSDTLAKFNRAMACVSRKNNGEVLFSINEGFRSALDQIKVKEEWIGKGAPQNAATPCCSNHSSGVAIDIKRKDGQLMSKSYNDSTGLTACMNEAGLYSNLDNEPWHWSPTGR